MTTSAMLVLLFCLVLTSGTTSFHQDNLNNRPIIGILAQHFHPFNPYPELGDSYISASYVKFLESAGARVVPIKINQDSKVIMKLLSNVNGVLFPGGDSDVANSPYQKNARAVFEYTMRERNQGRYFPLWGTCLGFQQLAVLAAGTDLVLSPSSGTWDVPLALPDLDRGGRMTESIPDDLFQIATVKPLVYHAHYNCVSEDAFEINTKLKDFYRVLSTNVDSNGKRFLSTIEGLFS